MPTASRSRSMFVCLFPIGSTNLRSQTERICDHALYAFARSHPICGRLRGSRRPLSAAAQSVDGWRVAACHDAASAPRHRRREDDRAAVLRTAGRLEDETSAPDRAEMVWQNSNGAYLIILLTAPQPSSGAADRDFAIAWRTLVENDPRLPLPSPIYDVRGSVGYAAKWSGGAVANRTREVALYILRPSVATFVPVVVVGPNRAVLDALYETVRMVTGSVRIAPLRAAPIKTTIGVADFVGDWKTGGASVVSYVNGKPAPTPARRLRLPGTTIPSQPTDGTATGFRVCPAEAWSARRRRERSSSAASGSCSTSGRATSSRATASCPTSRASPGPR